MRPQVVFRSLRAWDPYMLRWVQFMAHTGVDRGRVKSSDPFIKWLWDQILMVDD